MCFCESVRGYWEKKVLSYEIDGPTVRQTYNESETKRKTETGTPVRERETRGWKVGAGMRKKGTGRRWLGSYERKRKGTGGLEEKRGRGREGEREDRQEEEGKEK